MSGIDQTQAQPDETAVDAALAVLDQFMAALNAGDEPALLRHCISRITGWPAATCGYGSGPAPISATSSRVRGADWHRSAWDFRRIIAAGRDKGASRRAIHPLPRR